MPKQGDLRVWWIPQVPGKQFWWPVRDLREANLLLDVLAEYDLFQLKHRIKPDYCNAGGLVVWDERCPDDNGNCWVTWSDEETGDELDDYCQAHPELTEPLGKHGQ